ncbi:MAG TPA: TRAP transporter substrate-binding protein DctP [Bacillota bacterium]|nr:TRAP transporter substrate-binding protein DctP [Bacillota bacterium]
MKSKITMLLVITLILSMLVGCQPAVKPAAPSADQPAASPGEKYTWRIAIAETEDSSSAYWHKEFAKNLHEMNPNINLEIFYSGQLGDITDCIEMCMNGQLEFVDAGPQNSANYVPEVAVFNLHFFWPNDEDVLNKVLLDSKPAFKAVSDLYAPKNLKLLAMHSLGFLQMTSNKPIRTLDDMKGMKFRVMQSPILMNTYSLYGANPTPIPYMETYSALQLGTVEAEENQASCILDMKFHEVQKYLTVTNHAIMPGFICINQGYFDKLPADIQKTVLDAIEKTQRWFVDEKIDPKMQGEKLEKIRNSGTGIEFLELDPTERVRFEEAAKGVVDFYIQEYGKEAGAALVDTLRAEIAKAQGK